MTNHQTHFGDPIGSWLPDPRFYCTQRTPPTQDLGRTPYLQAAKMSWSGMYLIIYEMGQRHQRQRHRSATHEHRPNASSAHIYKVQTSVLRKMHEEFYQHIIVKSACWGTSPKKLHLLFILHSIIDASIRHWRTSIKLLRLLSNSTV